MKQNSCSCKIVILEMVKTLAQIKKQTKLGEEETGSTLVQEEIIYHTIS